MVFRLLTCTSGVLWAHSSPQIRMLHQSRHQIHPLFVKNPHSAFFADLTTRLHEGFPSTSNTRCAHHAGLCRTLPGNILLRSLGVLGSHAATSPVERIPRICGVGRSSTYPRQRMKLTKSKGWECISRSWSSLTNQCRYTWKVGRVAIFQRSSSGSLSQTSMISRSKICVSARASGFAVASLVVIIVLFDTVRMVERDVRFRNLDIRSLVIFPIGVVLMACVVIPCDFAKGSLPLS